MRTQKPLGRLGKQLVIGQFSILESTAMPRTPREDLIYRLLISIRARTVGILGPASPAVLAHALSAAVRSTQRRSRIATHVDGREERRRVAIAVEALLATYDGETIPGSPIDESRDLDGDKRSHSHAPKGKAAC